MKYNEVLFAYYFLIFSMMAIGIFVFSVAIFNTIRNEMDKVGFCNETQVVIDLRKQTSALQDSLIEYNSFALAVKEVGDIPYDRESSNCYDHSKALQQELRDMDIASSIMVNDDRSHAWLAVWIESTKGEFVSPFTDKNFSVMEARDHNLNVVCN